MYFSKNQEKGLKKITWFIAILLLFQVIQYVVYEFTPDTDFYILLWKYLYCFLFSFIFAWYFYALRKWLIGIAVQLLFVPILIYIDPLYDVLDYYTDFANSQYIYKVLLWVLVLTPCLAVSYWYMKQENLRIQLKSFSKVFGFVMVLFFVLNSNVDNLFNSLPIRFNSTSTIQYVFHAILIILMTLKKVVLLIGFYYMLNRLTSWQKFYYPLDQQFVNQKLFSIGFFVSFTLIFMLFIGLLKEFAAMTFNLFSDHSKSLVTYSETISHLIIMGLSARFLGFLIQYRSFSLRRYFGIFTALSLFPVINLISFFVSWFKWSVKSLKNYKARAVKAKVYHVFIYCALLILFYAFEKFPDTESEDLYYLIFELALHIGCIILLSEFKFAQYITPGILTLYFVYTAYDDFKQFNSISELFGISWLVNAIFVVISYYIMYYILHFIYHKSFYVEKNDTLLNSHLKECSSIERVNASLE